MEFSFGSEKWLPRESFAEKHEEDNSYALGLHAPGFFDKVLNVNKCLLQSEPANMVFPALLVLSSDYIFPIQQVYIREPFFSSSHLDESSHCHVAWCPTSFQIC